MALSELMGTLGTTDVPVDPRALLLAQEAERRKAQVQAQLLARQVQQENLERAVGLNRFGQERQLNRVQYEQLLRNYQEEPRREADKARQQALENELAQAGAVDRRYTAETGRMGTQGDIAASQSAAYARGGIFAVPGQEGRVSFMPGGTMEAQQQAQQRAYQQALVRQQQQELQQRYWEAWNEQARRQQADTARNALERGRVTGSFEGRPTAQMQLGAQTQAVNRERIAAQTTQQEAAQRQRQEQYAFNMSAQAARNAIASGNTAEQAKQIANGIFQQFFPGAKPLDFGEATTDPSRVRVEDRQLAGLYRRQQNLAAQIKEFDKTESAGYWGLGKIGWGNESQSHAYFRRRKALTKQLEVIQKKIDEAEATAELSYMRR